MINNSMTEKPEAKLLSFLVFIFLASTAFHVFNYHAIARPAMFHEYEQRLRAEFHLPPNAELIKLKDSRSHGGKSNPFISNPERTYTVEAIFEFNEADFEQYVKSLDDPLTWKAQIFSKTPASKFYVSENAHRWRDLPDELYAGIPFLFGSHFVSWDYMEPPPAKANKYFCYGIQEVQQDGVVKGIQANAKGYSCYITSCKDFSMSKTPLNDYGYPWGIVMGVLDYSTRRLQILIQPIDTDFACGLTNIPRTI